MCTCSKYKDFKNESDENGVKTLLCNLKCFSVFENVILINSRDSLRKWQDDVKLQEWFCES